MSKYRKKPVVIEAEIYQYGMEDGSDCELGHCNRPIGPYYCDCEKCGHLIPYIHTLEGNMRISVGDYIITGIKGERYPCKPDIFHETYEKVD